jgi:8-oxo-dGTP pyrophosphatase MutT (NUDIX family)
VTAGFAIGPERLLARTSVLDLVEADLTLPDGSTALRIIARHPGAAAVVPIDDEGKVILVRQYRVALDSELIEIPAGKRDVPGEPVEATAQRELAEEIGFEAGALELLTAFIPSPGFCDEVTHVFLGTDLTAVSRHVQTAEEQHMTIERWPMADAVAAVRSGHIIDAKTVIGLLLADGRR